MATDSAFAVNRAPCGYDYMAVFSDHTTCWANVGTAHVTLYNAYATWGGNNAGYTGGIDNTGAIDTEYFYRYYGTIFGHTETVIQITIY